VFLVLVAKAPATVWKVKRSPNGVIINLEKKREYVNHYVRHEAPRSRVEVRGLRHRVVAAAR
jgi:hypothetical protein